VIRSIAVGTGFWLSGTKQVRKRLQRSWDARQSADGMMSKDGSSNRASVVLRPISGGHPSQRQGADAILHQLQISAVKPRATFLARVHWRIKPCAPTHWLAAGHFHIRKGVVERVVSASTRRACRQVKLHHGPSSSIRWRGTCKASDIKNAQSRARTQGKRPSIWRSYDRSLPRKETCSFIIQRDDKQCR
jgi:hypothetical protein